MKLLAHADRLLLLSLTDVDFLQKFVRNQLQRALRPRLQLINVNSDVTRN